MLFKDKLELRSKHVLVTGGSAGIGLALAAGAVLRKAHVTIIARTAGKLAAAQAELEQLAQERKTGSKVGYQAADVSDAAQVRTCSSFPACATPSPHASD
jgi:3-dehydrosphinganine reductase